MCVTGVLLENSNLQWLSNLDRSTKNGVGVLCWLSSAIPTSLAGRAKRSRSASFGGGCDLIHSFDWKSAVEHDGGV